MYNKLKNWFLSSDEIYEDEDDLIQTSLIQFEITNLTQLNKIGDALKNHYILLCHISSELLIRTLDFISGLCFILEYTSLKITGQDYLFIPSTIHYLSHS